MQQTLRKPISCYGIGVHSGKNTQITLKPAPVNNGVLFIRTDISQVDNKIYAKYNNVYDTTLSTSIKNNAGITVTTIEHLMAAIWGCGIDNVIIEIDSSEIPIMDGSSQDFVFMIKYAGIKTQQNTFKKHLKLLKEVYINDNGCHIHCIPNNELHIDLSINFKNPVIGKQRYKFTKKQNFVREIANSRTFGFVHELDYLRSRGLAKGASLDNTIGIDKNTVLNRNGLRHGNEFVRHKMLDLIGDLFNTGGNFIGKVNAFKTSHTLNNKFLRRIFEDPYSYEWVRSK